MYWWKTTMQVLSVMASLLVILILATVWMRLLCPAFPDEPVVVKVELPEAERETAPVNTDEAESEHKGKSDTPESEAPPYFGEETGEDLSAPIDDFYPGYGWRPR